MLAVRAGARLVYAVENDPRNISTLEQTLAANGFTDRVVVIQGDVTTVDLPGPVDVIIGEMVATALIEEAQIPAMNNMHRFAKPGARVLLRSMELYADLVSRPDTFYGLRFPVVGYEYPDEPTLQCTPFTAAHQYRVVDFSRPIQDTTIAADFALVISPPPLPPHRTCQDAGGRAEVNGLRLSSTTIFWSGERFGASFAYCYPILLPLEPRLVEIGERYQVSIRYRMCEGLGSLSYNVARASR
jgi:predicted RNA methylase